MLIDCDHCRARGDACGDCVITVLLGSPPAGVTLDEEDTQALAVLADAGLVPPLRADDGAVPEATGTDGPGPVPAWVELRRTGP